LSPTLNSTTGLGSEIITKVIDIRYGARKAHLCICECRDTFTLQKHFSCLWETCPKTPPLQVGVWLFNLVPDELHTMSLFDDDDRELRLSRVVDELNQRFGKSAVYFANTQSVLDAAPTRISFTSVPELGEF